MQRAMRDPFRALFRRQIGIDELEQGLAELALIPPTGFILHMSRCGSTLITQMLASSPSNAVLSEGWAIDSVLTCDLQRRGVSEEDRLRWTRTIIRALGQRLGGNESRYFVKFDCWHTPDLPLLRRAFPGVPWVFVYRDPIEVLFSQMKRPAAWTVPGPSTIRPVGIPTAAAVALPPGEYPARVLSAICESALRMVSAGGMLLNYSELPDAVFSRLAEHFRCTFTAGECEAMRDTSQFDAKEPSYYFEPDSAAKQREAPPRVRELADRWLVGVYQRLEARRRA